MTAVGWLPADTGELFGTEATAEESYGVLTVDVPPASWITALRAARDRLGCTFFDWLSAVDEPGTGFRVSAHVAALAPVRRLLLCTTVPHDAPTLPSAVDVYAGAAWHERETHEMFGVDFTDHPGLDHLLLPDNFEGHPLRKDFVLAARVAKAWPGAKEPGESEHGGPKRRQMLPPGVPDPNEWGPLKGQLPPAPTRPARGAARTAGDRPPRRTRTAAEGSASQTPTGETPDRAAVPPRRSRTAAEGSASQTPTGETPDRPTVPPRRSRTAAEGSASQTPTGETPDRAATPPRRSRTAAEGSVSQSAEARPEREARPEPGAGPRRRARSASEGSASQRSDTPAAPRRARTASEGSASQRAAADEAAATGGEPAPAEGRPDRKPPVTPRSTDAPWHHARPAYTEPGPERAAEPDAGPRPDAGTVTEPGTGPVREAAPEPEPEAEGGRGQDQGDGEADGASRAAADVPSETGDDHPRTTDPQTRDSQTTDPQSPNPEDPSGGPR
ncbi:NADH-quinone oxidoreductase subunit C [Streptomyces sp. NPDC047860]|uniref:NADH-quinone oxidoreductase subunit C n=1 Tax=Streptomyces sp. NPDC047860 TaxID=3155743 RepID=UPI0033DDE17F